MYFRRNFGDVEVEIFFDQHEFKDADIVNINDIDLEENRDTDDEIEVEEGNVNNSTYEVMDELLDNEITEKYICRQTRGQDQESMLEGNEQIELLLPCQMCLRLRMRN